MTRPDSHPFPNVPAGHSPLLDPETGELRITKMQHDSAVHLGADEVGHPVSIDFRTAGHGYILGGPDSSLPTTISALLAHAALMPDVRISIVSLGLDADVADLSTWENIARDIVTSDNSAAAELLTDLRREVNRRRAAELLGPRRNGQPVYNSENPLLLLIVDHAAELLEDTRIRTEMRALLLSGHEVGLRIWAITGTPTQPLPPSIRAMLSTQILHRMPDANTVRHLLPDNLPPHLVDAITQPDTPQDAAILQTEDGALSLFRVAKLSATQATAALHGRPVGLPQRVPFTNIDTERLVAAFRAELNEVSVPALLVPDAPDGPPGPPPCTPRPHLHVRRRVTLWGVELANGTLARRTTHTDDAPQAPYLLFTNHDTAEQWARRVPGARPVLVADARDRSIVVDLGQLATIMATAARLVITATGARLVRRALVRGGDR